MTTENADDKTSIILNEGFEIEICPLGIDAEVYLYWLVNEIEDD